MKCNKCGNEYPSDSYFKTPGLCNNCYEQMAPEEKQEVDTAIYLHYQQFQTNNIMSKRVGFGKRFLAYLVDTVILSIIMGIIMFSSGYLQAVQRIVGSNSSDFMAMATQFATLANDYYLTFLFNQFIALFYFALEIVLGASIGKLLLGIQIADMNGKYASKSSLMMRYAYKHSSEILAVFGAVPILGAVLGFAGTIMGLVIFVGYFFIFSESKMSFHDKWSGTAVFHKSDLEELNGNNQ